MNNKTIAPPRMLLTNFDEFFVSGIFASYLILMLIAIGAIVKFITKHGGKDMQKIKELKAKLVAKRAERELNEDGFSLLELVVAIGIMLILTVGGLIGYSQITDNARKAAVESGASSVMTAAMVYESNGDDPQKAATDFNASSSNNQIVADVDESTNADGDKCFTVTVTHNSSGKVAERSNCTN